jgi:proteasome lid subunit RPN8/RPN11
MRGFGTMPRSPVMSLSSGSHPGPARIVLTPELVDAMIGHARAEYPNEACGVIVGGRPAADGGVPLRWVATRNAFASPYRYTIHPDDLYRLMVEVDDADDQVFWAIVHSHVRSAAFPSPTDVAQATYPSAIYLLVSLAEDEPALGAFRIVDGVIHPVEIVVGTAA